METEQNDETTFETIKRNKTIAIILGTTAIVALGALVYGFNQHSKVETQTKRADSLQLVSDSLHIQVQKYVDAAAAHQKKLAEEKALKEKQKVEAAKKHTAPQPTTAKSKKTKSKK